MNSPKFDYVFMVALTILALLVCIAIILDISPWPFVLSYWILTLIKNAISIAVGKGKQKGE